LLRKDLPGGDTFVAYTEQMPDPESSIDSDTKKKDQIIEGQKPVQRDSISAENLVN